MAFEVNLVLFRRQYARLAAHRDERVQLACHALAIDRGLDDGRQAFLGDVVDHVEDAQPATGDELVVHEIDDERAFGVAAVRIGARVPVARFGAFVLASAAHRQAPPR